MAPWQFFSLKEHLATLLPFRDCACQADTEDAMHEVPSFFSDKAWDLRLESAEEIIEHMSTAQGLTQPSRIVATHDPRKLPPFLFDKEWNLGSISSRFSASISDDSANSKRQRQHHRSFCIQPDGRFGMVLEETSEPLPGGLLVVTRLDAWSAFEKTADGSTGLAAGDVVVEVNGQRGGAAKLRETLRLAFSVPGEKLIDVVVRSRPASFNIELWRQGKHWRKLGIAADADDVNQKCLLVKSLHAEGLIPAWNAAHGSLRIGPGDRITHVNGICSDFATMKAEIQKSSKKGAQLRLQVVTPAGAASGCLDDPLEVTNGAAEPAPTVPWDMQVRWIDDSGKQPNSHEHS